MQRLASALALMVLLAACGGTKFDSTDAASPGATTPTTTRPSAVVTAAEKPYIDALTASDAASGSDMSATASHCIAAALVHGFGVSAFSSNGMTPNALRRAGSNLDALPDPTDQQVDAIGSALQRCNIGRTLAAGFAEGLKISDTKTVGCFATRFNQGPLARRFVVVALLGRKVDLFAAHEAVGVLASCIDLPTFVLRSFDVPVDATTRSCLVDALRASDSALKDFMALRISGADPDTALQASEMVSVAINRCRPSARTGFTVPGN
jgi:hypothetical protein